MRYISKYYFFYFILTFTVVFSVIFLFDYLEILKKFSTISYSGQKLVYIALLKNYGTTHKVLPFIALIASALTCLKLNTTYEIIAFRAIGLSMRKFILPIVLTAFSVGVFNLLILNPIGSTMYSKYKKLDEHYFKGDNNRALSVSDSGLWLYLHDKESIVMVNAHKIYDQDNELGDINFHFLTKDMQFSQRLVAKSAKYIKNLNWELTDVNLFNDELNDEHFDKMVVHLPLKFRNIRESLAPPETLSIFKLLYFIKLTGSTGLPVQKYIFYFYKSAASPLFLAAMALIGAIFGSEPPRNGKIGHLTLIAVIIGFILYFIGDIIGALGMSGRIPLFFAAIIPTIISSLIGIYIVLHKELHR